MNNPFEKGGITVITDRIAVREAPVRRTHLQALDLAIDGGAVAVQYRDKITPSRERLVFARKVRQLTLGRVPLIVNDDPRLAVAIGADGAHIGQQDMPPARAREILGSNMLLGLSIGSVAEAETAMKSGVVFDYFGLGPWRPSRTKPEAKPVKEDEINEILAIVDGLPVVAVGVDANNIERVRGSGIKNVAVVGAALRTRSPRESVRELSESLV